MSSIGLSEDDLYDILHVLDNGVTDRWDKFGLSLKLSKNDIATIDRDKDTQEDKLIQVLTLWLRDSLIRSGYGPPTWKILIEAVKSKAGGRNPALAKKIAAAKFGETKCEPTDEKSVKIEDAKLCETQVPIDEKSAKSLKTKRKSRHKKKKTSNPKATAITIPKPSVDTDKDTPGPARLTVPTQPTAPVRPTVTVRPTALVRPTVLVQPTPVRPTVYLIPPIQRPSVGATAARPQTVCRILLFRISVYLGAIFDGGFLKRRHKRDVHVETYKTENNGGILQIIDTFGPEIRERDETVCRISPDSILFCLPLTADTKTVKLERDTIETMKKLLRSEIFERAIIALTIPKGLNEEDIGKKLQSRQKNLEASFESYKMPPVVCISEDLLGGIPGHPEWYTQLWLEIFQSCSKEGLPVMAQYLAHRMHKPTDLTPNQNSDLLRPIPTDACDKAKWLIGQYHIEKALATSKSD